MTLPTTGQLSINDLKTEFGGPTQPALADYYAGGTYVPSGTTGTNGAVPSSGQISINNFYGTSAAIFAGFDTDSNTAAFTNRWVLDSNVGGDNMTAVNSSGRLVISGGLSTGTPVQAHVLLSEYGDGDTIYYDFSLLSASGYSGSLIRAVFFSRTTSGNSPALIQNVYNVEGPGDKSGSIVVPTGETVHLCVRLQFTSGTATFDKMLMSNAPL